MHFVINCCLNPGFRHQVLSLPPPPLAITHHRLPPLSITLYSPGALLSKLSVTFSKLIHALTHPIRFHSTPSLNDTRLSSYFDASDPLAIGPEPPLESGLPYEQPL